MSRLPLKWAEEETASKLKPMRCVHTTRILEETNWEKTFQSSSSGVSQQFLAKRHYCSSTTSEFEKDIAENSPKGLFKAPISNMIFLLNNQFLCGNSRLKLES